MRQSIDLVERRLHGRNELAIVERLGEPSQRPRRLGPVLDDGIGKRRRKDAAPGQTPCVRLRKYTAEQNRAANQTKDQSDSVRRAVGDFFRE